MAALAGTGCASSTSENIVRTLHRADLDGWYEARLQHISAKQREGLNPEECFEQLVLVIQPLPGTKVERTVKRVGVKGWPSWAAFKFGEIEARADASRTRVWFVDRASGKVIAAYDRESGRLTGPDDVPPDWARADTGDAPNRR